MQSLKELFKRSITQKIIVILLITLFFYVTRSMINLFLLTFLFTYLMYSLHNFILKSSSKYIKINSLSITIFLYSTFIVLIVLVVHKYFPVVMAQSRDIMREVQNFELNPEKYDFHKYLLPVFENIDIKDYLKNGTDYLVRFVGSLGKWSFNLIAALMLSLFFMIEKNKIKDFVVKFKKSKMSWVYNYTKYIGVNFLNSFGKVVQAQILIALANTVLSVISLSFMNFPQLLGLGVMIFIFSLIPVAGTILSLIPLSIIAFDIGGIIQVVYVIVMIAVIHALESYFLNPKFMADKTELPVFFIFIILIVSEHFMGIWGLLIGIPLFMFFLDLMGVNPKEA